MDNIINISISQKCSTSSTSQKLPHFQPNKANIEASNQQPKFKTSIKKDSCALRPNLIATTIYHKQYKANRNEKHWRPGAERKE